MDSGSTEKVAKGIAWSSAANWGSQLLSFAIYTGLARLLTPRLFGLVAIAWVYVAFIQLFVNQGFGTAIIQRRDLEPGHLDSSFWISMATALFFCTAGVLLGGQIARIFGEPSAAPVIRWLSLLFPITALSSVPTAILTRELNFRPLAFRSLAATGLGGAVGLTMAFLGRGVWSLVGQQLAGAVVGCTSLWLAVRWRPRLLISKRHLCDLFGFSLSITANDILAFFSNRSDQTLVGYGFGSAGLGPYSLASRLNSLLQDAITGPLQAVAFPAFSKLQSEEVRLEQALHKFCEMSTSFSLPLFAGVAVVAPELVPCLFGSRWASAVPILRILAFYGAVRAVLGFVHPLMLAKGRAGLYLVLFVIWACFTLAGCLLAVRRSPQAIAFSLVVTMGLFGAFELIVLAKALGIRLAPLMKTFLFPGLSTLFMAAVVALVRASVAKSFAPAATLIVCVTAGALVYVLFMLWARPDLVSAVCEMAGTILPRGMYRHRRSDSIALAAYPARAATRSSELCRRD
jgi:PST family polysaccharide transporter